MLKSMKMPVGLSWIFHNYILDHLDRMIEYDDSTLLTSRFHLCFLQMMLFSWLGCELQLTLMCKTAGMTISTSQFKIMVLNEGVLRD